jgi:hypothetical protein
MGHGIIEDLLISYVVREREREREINNNERISNFKM